MLHLKYDAMRRLILLLLTIFTLQAQAQLLQGPVGYGKQEKRFRALDFLGMPVIDTICDLIENGTNGTCEGAVVYRPDDSTLYVRTATYWRPIAKGTGDLSDYVPIIRSVNTTPPLSGGGDLSADRTLSIANAIADGSTKGAASFTANDFNSSAGNVSIDYTNGQSASGSSKGFLTAADWITFNGKAPASGGTGYIWNGTSAQTADFNITGGGRLGGGLGVGTTVAPTTAKIYSVSTTLPQLRLEHSTGNRLDITTGSNGSTSFNLTGTAPTFTFAQQIGASAGLTVTGTAAFNTIAALGSPATTFLTTNGGVLSSRTPSQVLSDISANLSNVLSLGNSALNDITLGANGNTNGYTYLARRNVSGTNYQAAFSVSANTGGGAYISSSNGTSSQDQIFRLVNGATGPIYSSDGGATGNDVWHAGNHPIGAAFTPTLTGANVLATLTTNSAGHVATLTTRALTATDIGAIQNQFVSAQPSSSFWISGSGKAGGNFTSLIGTGGAHYRMNTTGDVNRIAFGLSGTESGSNTGSDFMIWRYTDAGAFVASAFAVQRSTGFIGANETSPGAQFDVRGTSSSTGSALRVRNSTPTTLFQIDNNGDVTLFNGVKLVTGSGSPEGVVTAPTGSMYLNTAGGASTTLYVKTSGSGNTGWTAK